MSIERYFLEDRYLPGVIKNYNFRRHQLEFSNNIYELLGGYKSIVAEAPTGYGKTISYLIPLFELGRRTIISTKTKQLMNQILNKDIPIAVQLFDKELKITKLLGRRNYFCHYRYSKFILPYADIYPDVVGWADGIIENKITEVNGLSFDNDVINKITADSYQCLAGRCPYFFQCSFYNARESANSSDIVVTNHHMLLADVAMRVKFDGNYNFDFAEYIVFDEAHSIVDIFPSYLGEELNFYAILNFIKENRPFLGDHFFKYFTTKFRSINDRFRKTEIFNNQLEDQCMDLLSEIDKVLQDRLPEEEYSVFEKYKDTLSKVFKNDGIKLVENYGDSFSLKNIPVSSAEYFSDALFKSCISSLMISATITFNGSFDYVIKELGLENKVETIKLEPAENLISQGKVYINNEYSEDLEWKKLFYLDFFSRVRGAAIVIFNSLNHMREIGEFIKNNFPDKRLFFQTEDLQGIEIDEETVILGCSILREGIDFGGKGVKYLIIDKLPFENISDLYVKAKMDYYEEKYGNAFLNYYLPRAVIFFKQAVGRLIRNETDSGYWIILDGRVKTKNYGRFFLEVLKGAEKIEKFW